MLDHFNPVFVVLDKVGSPQYICACCRIRLTYPIVWKNSTWYLCIQFKKIKSHNAMCIFSRLSKNANLYRT